MSLGWQRLGNAKGYLDSLSGDCAAPAHNRSPAGITSQEFQEGSIQSTLAQSPSFSVRPQRSPAQKTGGLRGQAPARPQTVPKSCPNASGEQWLDNAGRASGGRCSRRFTSLAIHVRITPSPPISWSQPKSRLLTPSDRLITENRKNSRFPLRMSTPQVVASGKSSV